MGLLSFLSRKSSSDNRHHDAHIITQSYQNTVARAPPVRGEYPIGGNGSRHLETLARYHALDQSQLRLSSPAEEEPAPAPVVPTSRDCIVERPKTAPNERPLSLTVNRPNTSKTRPRKSYLSGQLPLSSSKSEHGSLRVGYSSDHFDRINNVGDYLHPVEEPPRPQTARQRSNSYLSASGRGFKDILDARSELKPLDFKSRIKASGARDYGEDVAERNIGENGHNLELPQVQAFYAQVTDADLLEKSKYVSVANMSRPYRRDAVLQSHIIPKPASLDSGLRTKSLNSSSAYIYKHQNASHAPQHPPGKAASIQQNLDQRPMASDAVSRRQSVTTHAISDANPGYTSERSKVRRLAYRGGPSLPLSPLRDALDMGVDRFGVTSLEHPLTSPPISKQQPRVDSPLAAEDCKKLALPADKKRESTGQFHAREDEHDIRTPSSHRSFPLKPSTRRRSGTASSVASSTKRHTMHSVKPSAASSMASYHTAIDTTALAYPTQRQPADCTRVAKRASLPVGLLNEQSYDLGAAEPSPSPFVKTGAARYELGNVHDNHQRTQSLTSSLRKLNTEGVSEVVPVRTSSLRNWSISSTTPTTSDTSSNPSQRPQSRTTATTSVDLGKDFGIKNASQLSVGDVPVLRSPGKSNAFNIDDYVSSDDDSLEPRLARGEGEEELLFSISGYGTGFQLPGLFDTLASSPPRQWAVTDETVSTRPRSSASSPPGYFHKPSGGFGSLSPRRRYILDTAADDDSDDDEDDTQGWHGGGAYTTSEMPSGIRHTKRLSALGSHYGHSHPAPDVIEEERDMSKIDIAAAVRQRKEEKARQRAAAAAAQRRLLKGKGKERATGLEADEGHRADVEC